MIDRISFSVPGGVAPELENVTSSWGNQFKGSLKNMTVIQSPEGVFVTGSIAKYLQGENVTPLNRRTVKEALALLASDTGWDLSKAELKQIEVGTTLPVSRPPSDYLNNWGVVPRFKKMTCQRRFLETVTYSTGNRSFSGYDKRAESKMIPPIYSDNNLIRLELKYKRGLKSYFHKTLSPLDLIDQEIYKILIQKWQDFYFSIPKGRKPVLDISGIVTPKDLDKILRLSGMKAFGDRYIGFINTLEEKGILGRVQAGRARKTAREIWSDPKISEPDDYTFELDSLVRALAK